MQRKVEEIIEKMLENGIIEHSNSPWASPIVFNSVGVKAKWINSFLHGLLLSKFHNQTGWVPVTSNRWLFRYTGWNEVLFYSRLGHWLPASWYVTRLKGEGSLHDPWRIVRIFSDTVLPVQCSSHFSKVNGSNTAWSKCIVYLDDILIMRRSFQEHLSNFQLVAYN